MKTIGILTGGGDCPGLNAAIRAVVKTAVGKFGCEIVGFKDGFKGLVKNEFINIKASEVSGLIDRGGTILGTSSLDNPLDVEWRNQPEKEMMIRQTIKENMAMHDMEGIIIIGGDQTMKTAAVLQTSGINVIGIPKSSANDVAGTDISFGYMTAVDTATEALDKLHSTAESHHRVMILEVMGDNSGWIALEAGVAGGADVILIPEIEYNINRVARAVLERKNAGKNFSIIIVAQGATPQKKIKCVEDEDEIEDVKIINLGSTGEIIAHEVQELTNIGCEVTVLGSLLRGGRPNTYDRLLSTRLGVRAAENAVEGNYGVAVVVRGRDIVQIPIKEIAEANNRVDPKGEWVRISKALGVSFGD